MHEQTQQAEANKSTRVCVTNEKEKKIKEKKNERNETNERQKQRRRNE